jgi:putative transposase
VRQAGQVRDAAVLMATGITPQGERQVLGVSVSLSEHEVHWKTFVKGLKDRGMSDVKLVISDDHEGLGAARRAILGSAPGKDASSTCNNLSGRFLTGLLEHMCPNNP